MRTLQSLVNEAVGAAEQAAAQLGQEAGSAGLAAGATASDAAEDAEDVGEAMAELIIGLAQTAIASVNDMMDRRGQVARTATSGVGALQATAPGHAGSIADWVLLLSAAIGQAVAGAGSRAAETAARQFDATRTAAQLSFETILLSPHEREAQARSREYEEQRRRDEDAARRAAQRAARRKQLMREIVDLIRQLELLRGRAQPSKGSAGRLGKQQQIRQLLALIAALQRQLLALGAEGLADEAATWGAAPSTPTAIAKEASVQLAASSAGRLRTVVGLLLPAVQRGLRHSPTKAGAVSALQNLQTTLGTTAQWLAEAQGAVEAAKARALVQVQPAAKVPFGGSFGRRV